MMTTRFTSMFQIPKFSVLVPGIFLMAIFLITGCSDDDDPEKENVPELITTANLTFTATDGSETVVGTAVDPDGEGSEDLTVSGDIELSADKEYTLAITMYNGLVDADDDDYNVTEEVEEESDEHMFFFAWSNDLFSDPTGDGNVDNRDDDINYNDEDANGYPVGLSTTWTTGDANEGTFRVLLKHQPDVKTATSTSEDGETDLDVTFTIVIE